MPFPCRPPPGNRPAPAVSSSSKRIYHQESRSRSSSPPTPARLQPRFQLPSALGRPLNSNDTAPKCHQYVIRPSFCGNMVSICLQMAKATPSEPCAPPSSTPARPPHAAQPVDPNRPPQSACPQSVPPRPTVHNRAIGKLTRYCHTKGPEFHANDISRLYDLKSAAASKRRKRIAAGECQPPGNGCRRPGRRYPYPFA